VARRMEIFVGGPLPFSTVVSVSVEMRTRTGRNAWNRIPARHTVHANPSLFGGSHAVEDVRLSPRSAQTKGCDRAGRNLTEAR
jgi:hypothetical protein